MRLDPKKADYFWTAMAVIGLFVFFSIYCLHSFGSEKIQSSESHAPFRIEIPQQAQEMRFNSSNPPDVKFTFDDLTVEITRDDILGMTKEELRDLLTLTAMAVTMTGQMLPLESLQPIGEKLLPRFFKPKEE